MKITNICCIGAGYVGGPTMAVIALKCPYIKVTVVDINEQRIAAWNHADLDQLPIYEPGLKEIVAEARGRNLFFSTDVEKAIEESQMIFMAVNTPTKTYGEGKGFAADLTFVEKCARQIAEVANSDKIVIEKSTLPVRTAEKIKKFSAQIQKEFILKFFPILSFWQKELRFKTVFKSDRVLVGGDDTETGKAAVACFSFYLC